MSRFSVVIPARYGSTRLPGKALLDIAGKTMITRVAEQAKLSEATHIVVASDDQRVLDAVSVPGVEVCMTRGDHLSGSDRVMEVVELKGWLDDHVVVNVQGDEPLIPPAVINQVAHTLGRQTAAFAATLSEPLTQLKEVFDENIVKVVVTKSGRALYFSRAAIPYARQRFSNVRTGALEHGWRRHIGIYAYRTDSLRRFVGLNPGGLEQIESLEQLRFIENDLDILVEEAVTAVPVGVDTLADIERVRSELGAIEVSNTKVPL